MKSVLPTYVLKNMTFQLFGRTHTVERDELLLILSDVFCVWPFSIRICGFHFVVQSNLVFCTLCQAFVSIFSCIVRMRMNSNSALRVTHEWRRWKDVESEKVCIEDEDRIIWVNGESDFARGSFLL